MWKIQAMAKELDDAWDLLIQKRRYWRRLIKRCEKQLAIAKSQLKGATK